MKVFVLNADGKPLMPCSPREARLLLKEGRVRVVNGVYFTIKMIEQTTSYTQDITIGVDCGIKTVGISIRSGNTELKSMEVELRRGVSSLIKEKAMYRRNKRGRKTRYRKPRFNNRAVPKGWLAPSAEHKLNEHIRLIDGLLKLLPNVNLILETASFDIQRIENPNIQGVEYQQGEMYGYTNVKEYVLYRDNHKCQCPKTKCSERLEVHHIKFRSNGGSDKPSNLITLCEKHHKELHKGKWSLDITRVNKSLRSATIMNIIKGRLLEYYDDATETFGYITKVNRQLLGLSKTHYNDAFVIAGGNKETKRSEVEYYKFKRKNNRCIQINQKGRKPSIRKQRYPLQPNDVVLFNGKKHRVAGTQNKGTYILLKNDKKPKNIKYIKLLYNIKTLYKVN